MNEYELERNNDDVSFSYASEMENVNYWYSGWKRENNDGIFSFSSSLMSERFPLQKNPWRRKAGGQGNVVWTLDYSWFSFTDVFAVGEPSVPFVLFTVITLWCSSSSLIG